jgi:ABC-type branched-subunit amino acid transport system substrate-binding protein
MIARHRRGFAAVVSVGTAALLVAACSSSGSPSSKGSGAPGGSGAKGSASAPAIPDGPMTVCVSIALSGLTATHGQEATYQAAADIVNNQYGGIAGHKVSFELLNDSGKANKAITNMNQFVDEHKKNPNKCVAEVGMDYDPSIQPNMVAVANKAKMITILDSSVDAYSDASKYPYLFPISPSDKAVGEAMGKYIASRGWKRWGVITDNIPQETEQINDDLAGAKAAGLDAEIIKTVSVPPGSISVQTQLLQLKAANPDVVLVMLGLGYGAVWTAMNTIGWKPNIVGDLAAFYFEYDALKGLASNAFSPAWFGQIPNHKALPQRVLDLMKTIGPYVGAPHYPGLLIGAAQDINKLMILKYAVEKANSVDSDALKAALETMNDTPLWWQGSRFTYTPRVHTGLVGPYSAGAMRMDELGDNGIFVYATPNGSPVSSDAALASLDDTSPVFPDKK